MAYVLFATKNVPLDPSYKDVIRFEVSTIPNTSQDTIPEVRDAFMTTYFRNYADTSSIYKSYANYNEVNFDYGDGINTVLNYDLSKLLATPQSQYDQVMNLALNSNYLHFRPTAAAGTNTDRFYFIRSARQLNANVVQFVLELDIFSTYPQMNMTGGLMTERAHVNRFVNKGTVGSPKWVLDSPDSWLGDQIETQFKAMIPEKINSTIQYTNPAATEQIPVNNWLNECVWMYFWFSEPFDQNSYRLQIVDENIATWTAFNTYTEGFQSGLQCRAVPLKKALFLMINSAAANITATTDAKEAWYVNSNLTACVAITLSPYPPFRTYANGGNIYPRMTVDANGDLNINYQGAGSTFVQLGNPPTTPNNNGTYRNDIPEITLSAGALSLNPCIELRFIRSGDFLYSPNINLKTALGLPLLTSAPPYNKTRDENYEPKLFSSPFRRLSLRSIYTQEKDFSPMLLDNTSVKTIVQEIPNPVQQKPYMSLIPGDLDYAATKSPYSAFKNVNLGLVSTNIYSYPLRKDPFSQYIQERGLSAITSVAVNTAQAFAGNPLPLIQQGAQLLDLAQQPDSVKNIGNDYFADYAYGLEFDPFIVDYKLSDKERTLVLDYFFNQGYQINQVKTLDANANTGLFLRTRFNFVKANDLTLIDRVFQTGATMSKPIRERIQKAFNDGITFWQYYGLSTDSTKGISISFINSNIFDRTAYENLEKIFAYT